MMEAGLGLGHTSGHHTWLVRLGEQAVEAYTSCQTRNWTGQTDGERTDTERADLVFVRVAVGCAKIMSAQNGSGCMVCAPIFLSRFQSSSRNTIPLFLNVQL